MTGATSGRFADSSGFATVVGSNGDFVPTNITDRISVGRTLPVVLEDRLYFRPRPGGAFRGRLLCGT